MLAWAKTEQVPCTVCSVSTCLTRILTNLYAPRQGYAAYEMLRRLKLEVKYNSTVFTDDVKKTKYQKAVSRALWGISCFERCVNTWSNM